MIKLTRSALAGRGLPVAVAAALIALLALIVLLVARNGESAGRPYGPLNAVAQAAAPDPAERWRRSFVGEVDGTDALIGLALEPSGRLVAYVCNGDPDDLLSERHFGVWYSGGVAGGTARLTATASLDAPGALPVATGTVKGNQAEQTANGFVGTVTIADGTSNTFTAEAATAPAGLYREVVVQGANGIDIGWVRRDDGTITGHARLVAGFADLGV
jgi:hypothetical protein